MTNKGKHWLLKSKEVHVPPIVPINPSDEIDNDRYLAHKFVFDLLRNDRAHPNHQQP